MTPDKLFDYLEGRLSPSERNKLEDRIISDPQLQRELAVVQRIHASIRGDSREIMLSELEKAERGRKLALRVGLFFIVLMAANVGAGLWIIARHESKNPNRALLEKQTREQIEKSLEKAAAAALTPPPSLGINEVTLTVPPGHLSSTADQIVAAAGRVGGLATKGLPDDHRITVLADVPSNRVTEFGTAVSAIGGSSPAPSPAAESTTSFVIHIVDSFPAPPQ
jgi:anti-sigma factor RsiW